MRLPGFNAEAALIDRQALYQGVAGQEMAGGGVVPAWGWSPGLSVHCEGRWCCFFYNGQPERCFPRPQY
jgi:hypothetical protein